MVQKVQSFVQGHWVDPGSGARTIAHAITGDVIAEAGSGTLDFGGMIDFAKAKGGAALRAMSFHQRADMLKTLALYLNEHKDVLYDVSFATGATATDHLVDVDGGIGTLFVYASKGKKELPDSDLLLDGGREQFGKEGVFLGQHVYTSKPGVAVHVNAFNFPVWGMLEKLAPSLLAGVPSVVKPATVTCYVTEACVRLMNASGALPEGAVQLVTGGLGNTLDLLSCQDVVTFTGSAETALHLRETSNLVANGVPFSSEQDSLNASILGPDATVGTPEFDLFIKEVAREMTMKAGQKCTAVRRILVPSEQVSPVIEALSARLGKTTVGDPKAEGVRMGALVSQEQRADVLSKADVISTEAEIVYGGQDGLAPIGADIEKGAFVAPTLFHCADPDAASAVHETEAFGPISTIMGYRDLDHAIALANRGQGSLVASVITHDPAVARAVVVGAGPYHGRLYFNDRASMSESTGHGAPMPHMVHGGPGRAGGGEELGGIRGVKHFMQRTAVQGGPGVLDTLVGGPGEG
jgi:oxepin-CoA hydrolase/3-oxo-5,6-dehydrosuberyl-CoA semialdehyde dehydrogenase